MQKTKNVLEILEKIKVAKLSELESYDLSPLQISRLAASGEILSLGAGFYAHPSLDPFVGSIIAVARHYPAAVISKATALVIHKLSDERIDRVDIDISRNSSIRNKLIRAHRTAESRLIGIEQTDYHGEMIRIYDRERALSEAYSMDPDGDLFLKALKRYSSSQEPNTEKIAEYDKLLSTHVLRAIRQEMAVG
jgi:predicted transcriptional regulator of viral defense system